MKGIISLILFLTFFSCESQVELPSAKDGTLDLRSWNWNQGPIDLKGEWLFTPSQFLNPMDAGAYPVEVPGFLSIEGKPRGFGTYTLRILLPKNDTALGLRIPIIGTSSELWINGLLLVENGNISSSSQTYVPSYQPKVIEFPLSLEAEYQITIKVANFDDVFTGMGFPLSLGSSQDIHKLRETALGWESVIFGALFLMGLYHFGYFIFRPKDFSPFWFGLFCITIALRSTLYSELIFLNWFPGTSWYLILRGVYLTMVIPASAFLLFVHGLYPKRSWKRLTQICIGFMGLFGLAFLLLPVAQFTELLIPFQILLGVVGIYSLTVVGRALYYKEKGSALFVIGTGLFLLTIFLDIFKNHFNSSLPSLVPWGTLAFLVLQGLVLTRRFSSAFTLAEEYSAHLATLNNSLERFIPREVLGFLAKKSIVEIALGDYSEQRMTVFFLDIRDFTPLSESMTPRENFRFINSFLGRFGPLIRSNGGFVDKYLGDGLMALFPQSPEDALRAALDMRDSLDEYNQGRIRSGYRTIRFGIGIHTGQLMLGTIGENKRMDSTVISDTVNAASRLEGLTKKFQTDILVSGETVRSIVQPQEFTFDFLGNETVKGKTQAMEVYLVKKSLGSK